MLIIVQYTELEGFFSSHTDWKTDVLEVKFSGSPPENVYVAFKVQLIQKDRETSVMYFLT